MFSKDTYMYKIISNSNIPSYQQHGCVQLQTERELNVHYVVQSKAYHAGTTILGSNMELRQPRKSRMTSPEKR
jgi:hypothetical protein